MAFQDVIRNYEDSLYTSDTVQKPLLMCYLISVELMQDVKVLTKIHKEQSA